jgi:hypothetical protein
MKPTASRRLQVARATFVAGPERTMMRSRGWLLGITLSAATAALAAPPPSVWSFDDAEVGAAPPGFDFMTTQGAPAGRWAIERDGEKNRVLAQLDQDPTDRRFAMAVLRELAPTDVRLSVRGKAISGQVDQAIGLVWRWQDADNYYVARANALESNVRLYRVVNGNRIKFAGVENVEIAAGAWHTLAIEQVGARIRVSFDQRELFQAEDRTYAGRGRVGLWIKADSVTWFDDLQVEPLDPS